MKQKTLTKEILIRFVIKVLNNVNQNNFLTIGPAQDLEIKKISKIVNEFFIESD